MRLAKTKFYKQTFQCPRCDAACDFEYTNRDMKLWSSGAIICDRCTHIFKGIYDGKNMIREERVKVEYYWQYVPCLHCGAREKCEYPDIRKTEDLSFKVDCCKKCGRMIIFECDWKRKVKHE